MGRIVIAAYRPKPGKADELRRLASTHLPLLRSQDLVTDRSEIIMQARDGTIVEVFEWASREAIESAHSNPEVLKMWDEFFKICDFVPIADVEEAGEMFSEFAAV